MYVNQICLYIKYYLNQNEVLFVETQVVAHKLGKTDKPGDVSDEDTKVSSVGLAEIKVDTKTAILRSLAQGKKRFIDLTDELDTSKQRTSNHLRDLKDGGQVKPDRHLERWIETSVTDILNALLTPIIFSIPLWFLLLVLGVGFYFWKQKRG